MTDPFLHCNVLCWNQAQVEKSKDLGLEVDENETDTWQPFTIDLRTVQAIRIPVSGTDGVRHEDQAVIYIEGNPYTIDVPYKEVVEKWKKIKL